MKHLKLVVNNTNTQRDPFFSRNELQTILNLYAKMVSNGEWKDYGLSISKKEVSFNIYYRVSDMPIYKITKNLISKNSNENYFVKNSKNQIIKNSHSLENLINKIVWKKLKLVN